MQPARPSTRWPNSSDWDTQVAPGSTPSPPTATHRPFPSPSRRSRPRLTAGDIGEPLVQPPPSSPLVESRLQSFVIPRFKRWPRVSKLGGRHWPPIPLSAALSPYAISRLLTLSPPFSALWLTTFDVRPSAPRKVSERPVCLFRGELQPIANYVFALQQKPLAADCPLRFPCQLSPQTTLP